MCGLIACFNTQTKQKDKSVNEYIINQFENQYDRGQKGFGIIRIDKKKRVQMDKACETTKFLLDLYMKKSNMIIAHHRTPTSTENTMEQTHPMEISNQLLKHDYYVIHNGMLSNDAELRQKHIELGFEYKTECYKATKYQTTGLKWNDSEAIAIELALFIEGKISAIGTENNAAFIALQTKKGTNIAEKVFFGKNGAYADLNIDQTKRVIKISSEGIGEEVKTNELFSFDLNDKKMEITSKPMPFKRKEIPKVEETKATAPLNLPSATKSNSPKKSIIFSRSWVNDNAEDAEETEYADLPEYAGVDYIKDLCIDFKEDLKEADYNGITHMIDDKLDEELEKINDIVKEYKDILLTDILETKEEEFYTDQIKRIMVGMKAITNIADTDYADKKQAEIDFEDYNGVPYSETKGRKIGYTVNNDERTGWTKWDKDPQDVDPRTIDIYEGEDSWYAYNNGEGPRD